MTRHTQLKFAPEPLTRAGLVSEILLHAGLPYNEKTTVAEYHATRVSGYGNCFGVLLLAAIRKKLLPPTFNVDLPPMLYGGQSVVKSLWEIIDYNFDRVAPVDMQPGDIILTRYHDVNPDLSEPHHVLACVNTSPTKFFHANDSVGYSHIVDSDPLMWNRIEGVYACKNFSL